MRGKKECSCSQLGCNEFCSMHDSLSRQQSWDLERFVSNGICYFCRADNNDVKRAHRERVAANATTLSPGQLAAHLLLGMEALSMEELPTQGSTSIDEVSNIVLDRVLNYALSIVYRTDKHGERGKFRKLNKNAKQMKVLAVEAERFGVYGRSGTKENGAQQLFRLYNFLTRSRMFAQISKIYNDEDDTFNWTALRSKISSP